MESRHFIPPASAAGVSRSQVLEKITFHYSRVYQGKDKYQGRTKLSKATWESIEKEKNIANLLEQTIKKSICENRNLGPVEIHFTRIPAENSVIDDVTYIPSRGKHPPSIIINCAALTGDKKEEIENKILIRLQTLLGRCQDCCENNLYLDKASVPMSQSRVVQYLNYGWTLTNDNGNKKSEQAGTAEKEGVINKTAEELFKSLSNYANNKEKFPQDIRHCVLEIGAWGAKGVPEYLKALQNIINDSEKCSPELKQKLKVEIIPNVEFIFVDLFQDAIDSAKKAMKKVDPALIPNFRYVYKLLNKNESVFKMYKQWDSKLLFARLINVLDAICPELIIGESNGKVSKLEVKGFLDKERFTAELKTILTASDYNKNPIKTILNALVNAPQHLSPEAYFKSLKMLASFWPRRSKEDKETLPYQIWEAMAKSLKTDLVRGQEESNTLDNTKILSGTIIPDNVNGAQIIRTLHGALLPGGCVMTVQLQADFESLNGQLRGAPQVKGLTPAHTVSDATFEGTNSEIIAGKGTNDIGPSTMCMVFSRWGK